jgi:hypothetical protein
VPLVTVNFVTSDLSESGHRWDDGSFEAVEFELSLRRSGDRSEPRWWIGITNASGELVRAEGLDGGGHQPSDVLQWLSPITGAHAAQIMVRGAVQAAAGEHRKVAAEGG